MDDDDRPSVYAGSQMSNDAYTSSGVLKLRLDTQPMLDSINNFLRGRALTGYELSKEGVYVPVFGAAGKPKANEEGIQSIMSWLTPSFSPHTVQGNYRDREELNLYLCRIQKGLAQYIMANREVWEISGTDYDGIVDMFMTIAEPFFSRLLANKERESYGQTMRVHETNSFQEQPRKGGGFFGGLLSGRRA